MGFLDWFKKPEPVLEDYYEDAEASLLIFATSIKKMVESERWTMIDIEDSEERCEIEVEQIEKNWELMLFEYPSQKTPEEAFAEWGVLIPEQWTVRELECGEFIIFTVPNQQEPEMCRFIDEVYRKVFDYGGKPYNVTIYATD